MSGLLLLESSILCIYLRMNTRNITDITQLAVEGQTSPDQGVLLSFPTPTLTNQLSGVIGPAFFGSVSMPQLSHTSAINSIANYILIATRFCMCTVIKQTYTHIQVFPDKIHPRTYEVVDAPTVL